MTDYNCLHTSHSVAGHHQKTNSQPINLSSKSLILFEMINQFEKTSVTSTSLSTISVRISECDLIHRIMSASWRNMSKCYIGFTESDSDRTRRRINSTMREKDFEDKEMKCEFFRWKMTHIMSWIVSMFHHQHLDHQHPFTSTQHSASRLPPPAPRPPLSTSSPPQHLVPQHSSHQHPAHHRTPTLRTSTPRTPHPAHQSDQVFLSDFHVKGHFHLFFLIATKDQDKRSLRFCRDFDSSKSIWMNTGKEYQLSKLKTLFILYSVIIFTLNTLND
jgi:hypothetical protein